MGVPLLKRSPGMSEAVNPPRVQSANSLTSELQGYKHGHVVTHTGLHNSDTVVSLPLNDYLRKPTKQTWFS